MVETFERVKELLAARFQLDSARILRATPLTELGIDSLDALEFVFDLENAFLITLDGQADLRGGIVQDITDAVNSALSRQKQMAAGD